MLNKTDLKIIIELQKNGRASYTDLATTLGLSTATVAKRTENLIASKAICIRAIPNPFKLGLIANAVIGIKTDPKKIDAVSDKLAHSFNVNLVKTVFGRFDILTVVFFPTWEMLHDFVNDEMSKMEGVLELECYHIREVKKRYHLIFGDRQKYESAPSLKEIDRKILEELTIDGRIPTNELARKLGTHTSTVSRRIGSLLRENIIKITAVPNPSLFGYASDAIISVEVAPNKAEQICAELAQYREINLILTLINASGLIVGTHTSTNEALYHFVKTKIAYIDGILRTETNIRAEFIKRYYGWFLEESEV